jgi:prolipoprotein diacylglyceryltransferase
VVRLWCHIYYKHHKHPYKGCVVVWYVVWYVVGKVFIELMIKGLKGKR